MYAKMCENKTCKYYYFALIVVDVSRVIINHYKLLSVLFLNLHICSFSLFTICLLCTLLKYKSKEY